MARRISKSKTKTLPTARDAEDDGENLKAIGNDKSIKQFFSASGSGSTPSIIKKELKGKIVEKKKSFPRISEQVSRQDTRKALGERNTIETIPAESSSTREAPRQPPPQRVNLVNQTDRTVDVQAATKPIPPHRATMTKQGSSNLVDVPTKDGRPLIGEKRVRKRKSSTHAATTKNDGSKSKDKAACGKNNDSLKPMDSGYVDDFPEQKASSMQLDHGRSNSSLLKDTASARQEAKVESEEFEDGFHMPSLTQKQVKNRETEETIFWLASPPRDTALTGKRDTENEVDYLATILGRASEQSPRKRERISSASTPISKSRSCNDLPWSEFVISPRSADSPRSKQNFKRSFSLSNIENSPSTRMRGGSQSIERKRLRESDGNAHWATLTKVGGGGSVAPATGKVALKDFIARCQSAMEESSKEDKITSSPQIHQPGMSTDARAKALGAQKRHLERSFSLPVLPSTPSSAAPENLSPSSVKRTAKHLGPPSQSPSTPIVSNLPRIDNSPTLPKNTKFAQIPHDGQLSPQHGNWLSASKQKQNPRRPFQSLPTSSAKISADCNKENIPPTNILPSATAPPSPTPARHGNAPERAKRRLSPVVLPGTTIEETLDAFKDSSKTSTIPMPVPPADEGKASDPFADNFPDVEDDDFACGLALDEVMMAFDEPSPPIAGNGCLTNSDPKSALQKPAPGISPAVKQTLDEVMMAFDEPSPPIAGNGCLTNSDPKSALQKPAPGISPAVKQTETPAEAKIPRYTRFLVLEVSWGEYGLDTQRCSEKRLRLFDEVNVVERHLHLREDWYYLEAQVGDYINVLGEFDTLFHRCIADNEQSLVVLHPDTLISATHAADSFHCLRKSVLQDRIRSYGEISPPMVHGRMLHCLLQACLLANNFTTEYMHEEIAKQIRTSIADLYAIQESELQAANHLKEYIPRLQQWSQTFLGDMPQPNAVVSRHRSTDSTTATVALSSVIDIEETMWSPMYGLKGSVDVTLTSRLMVDGKMKTLLAPLELKSGQNSKIVAHRAQTSLYMLMMSDRYNIDVAHGILYYLNAGEMISVPNLRDEVRGLIIQRNAMAIFLVSRSKLPPMLGRSHTCERCYVRENCFVYHKAVEGGTTETSQVGTLFDDQTAHLTADHIAFYDTWERLITMEEGDMSRLRKEIWTLMSSERERLQRCFSNMQIVREQEKKHEIEGGGGTRRFRYRFERATDPVSQDDSKSLLNSHITVGDPVVISTEAGQYALAIGWVKELQERAVIVDVDRQLKGGPRQKANFDRDNYQDFEEVVTFSTNRNAKPIDSSSTDQALYRLDKDELTTGMGLVRGNLISLFTVNGDTKRRRLIVDLEPPVFHHQQQLEGITPMLDQRLNVDQRRAVDKVLSASDYALILGMPGTGKTTTIAYLIAALLARGKSVLLTSYTHSAVDNVLLKLKEENIDFLRLGSSQKVHPMLQAYTESGGDDIETVDQLAKFYESKKVVATTCLGINHNLFAKRRFDYCIVDEASQLTLPVCLGPLRSADVFVLVGDQYQLPPLVRNPEARATGLASSLFKRLSEAHPEAVTYLEHQYRMNADIMLLSNTLIYNHRLRCGTEGVAKARLELEHLKRAMDSAHQPRGTRGRCDGGTQCWIAQICDPSRNVIFLNTDQVPALETRRGDLIQNDVEAELVRQISEILLLGGLAEQSLGIISPYRAQLKLLNQHLGHHPHLAIQTVDKFQGSDRDCILFSLVRSNEKQSVGELLRDWRRLNVAFTRAKRKVVILGSRETLRGTAVLAEFLDIIDRKGWEIQLPPIAHMLHHIQSPHDSSSDAHSETGKRSNQYADYNHQLPPHSAAATSSTGHKTTAPQSNIPSLERPLQAPQSTSPTSTHQFHRAQSSASAKINALTKGRPGILKNILKTNGVTRM